MKTSTAVVSGIAALALLGGGTAYALSTAGDPASVETPAAVSTETPAPENTVDPTPSAEPTPEATEPVETPEPTPEPTPTVEYSEGEAMLIHVTKTGELATLALDDEAILAAAQTACSLDSSSEFAASGAIATATEDQAKQFWIDAEYHVCN